MDINKRRGAIFIGVAIILTLATGICLSGYAGSVEGRLGPTVPVLVVKQAIPARTVLTSDFLAQGRLDIKEIPLAFAPKSSVQAPRGARQNPNLLANLIDGYVTLIDLMEGDILQFNQIDRNAGLGPDMRAVSLAVNQATSVGGAVRPGNRVDILVSYEAEDRAGKKCPRTELLLQDVLVLHVYPSPAGATQEGGTGQPRRELRFTPTGEMMRDTTVTLALRPEDAMKLTFMSNFAKEIRLMIRRLDQAGISRIEPVTTEGCR